MTCSTCGIDVEARDVGTLDGPITLRSRHDAPCGAPCMGGGIGRDTVDALGLASLREAIDASHRKTNCPKCNP